MRAAIRVDRPRHGVRAVFNAVNLFDDRLKLPLHAVLRQHKSRRFRKLRRFDDANQLAPVTIANRQPTVGIGERETADRLDVVMLDAVGQRQRQRSLIIQLELDRRRVDGCVHGLAFLACLRLGEHK